MSQTRPHQPDIDSAKSRLESITLRMYDAGLPIDVGATKPEPKDESVAEVARRLGALDLRLEILRRTRE